MKVKKISAVTLKVASMRTSIQFYRDVLGMEMIYGGEDSYFSSLRTMDTRSPILNLEQGRSVTDWGRMIFYVPDVDAMWVYLKEKGFHPESPQDASWGERGEVCEDSDATLLGAGCRRDGVPEMKQHLGYVLSLRTILLNRASSFGRYSPVCGARRRNVSTGSGWAVRASVRL